MNAVARPRSPAAVLAAVGFSVFVAADDLTVVSTMLRPIIGDLGLVLPEGLDDASWAVNAYLIAFIAVMPVSGRLSDVIGRRRAFVAAYVCFLVGTVVIPLSTSTGAPFAWFIVGRILTAVGGGAMVPVALAVVGDTYREGPRARALGTLGAIETMGWVWGPLYGALLVRFLSWQWQFWLNVPLAAVGLVLVWRALDGHEQVRPRVRIDWPGAALLTAALVSLNLALLSSAEIQSVTGLDQLGGSGPDLRWLYPVALVATAAFVAHQRRSPEPLVAPELVRGRSLRVALVVNFLVGAVLVIAMVDVPLFVNAVEVDLERSAVVAGWVLSAMTAAMAVTSYLGGRMTVRTSYRPPVLIGTAGAAIALGWMGATLDSDPSYVVFAVQLALLGAGLGLTVAPTTSAVVDAASPERRGAAASAVMVVRLLGFSVGLSALTAWGLARFNALRTGVELPPLTDPGFDRAVREAQASLTARSIAETFTAAAVVAAVAGAVALAIRSSRGADMPPQEPISGPSRPDASVASSGAEATEPMVLGTPSDRRHPGTGTAPAGPLRAWRRRTELMVGVLAFLLLGALVLVSVLFVRLGAVRDDLDTTRADLERVEAGAALYASQVTGLQDLLSELGPGTVDGLDEAIDALESFATATLEVSVAIDEELPVSTEFVISREVEVPVTTSIPIQQTFDTTIDVDTPLGFSVPVDVSVPIDITVPVDVEVTIPIDETVPIEQTIPVSLDVPIEIDVSETALAELTTSLAEGLRGFRDALGGLGAD